MINSMKFRKAILSGLAICSTVLWGCQTEMTPIGVDTRVVINDAMPLSQPTVDGIDGGPPRKVAAVVSPDGSTEEFVSAEVVYRPKSDEELNAFLEKYNGVVLRDGTYTAPEGVNDSSFASSGYYLIRIDATASPTDDLSDRLAQIDRPEAFSFSSMESACTVAAALREPGVSLNFLYYPQAVNEHPKSNGDYIDASRWWWMTEDDDLNTPQEEGLSVGVVHAWEYLAYMNLPPNYENGGPTVWSPARVAVIDRGFALDSTTGLPLNDNQDYFYYGNNGPVQFDFVDNDNRPGHNESDWHGQSSFGICCARPRNGYGSAGTGGSVVIPMIFRTGSSAYTLSDAISFAGIWGADVINISMGRECGILCDYIENSEGAVQSAIYTATAFGAVVVAAAGNGNNTDDLSHDISDRDLQPCKMDAVVCVGAVDNSKMNVFNYGDGVDIWAPTLLRTTVNPDTAGNTGIDALPTFWGTSCASPFVAGVVGLMKTLDPDLRWDDVEQILRDTANTSPDPKVAHGYIDAYRAVLAVGPENLPPTVRIVSPNTGSTRSWTRSVSLLEETEDPEQPSGFKGRVDFYSDREGYLCTAPCVFENAPILDMGEHVITAVADDGHGGVATSAPITIEITNDPPTAEIRNPVDGATVYADQNVNFRGYTFDWDETILAANMIWTSSIDGEFGSGRDFPANLSVGDHEITLTVVDGKGESAVAVINLSVLDGVGVPSARIESPDAETFANSSYTWTFNAITSDPEDGVIGGDNVKWYSDIDGLLGTGDELKTTLSGPPNPCNSSRYHTITLEVTDSDGNTTTDTMVVGVGQIC